MKSLFTTATIAALVISGSQLSAQIASEGADDEAASAFAQSPQAPRAGQQGTIAQQAGPNLRARSSNRTNDVYDTQGNYVGSDPDLFIRNDLMRAPPNRDDN